METVRFGVNQKRTPRIRRPELCRS